MTKSRLKVVIVDDSPYFLDSARNMFASYAGIEVVGTASSGHEALGLVAALQPDAVFIDLMMPGMNGLETLRRLDRQGGRPRVALISMNDSPDVAQWSLDSGADAFVAKDELFDALPRLAREWFDRELS